MPVAGSLVAEFLRYQATGRQRKTPLLQHCRRADLAVQLQYVRHPPSLHHQTRHKAQEGCRFMTCLSTELNAADKLNLQGKRTGSLQDWFPRTLPSIHIALNPDAVQNSIAERHYLFSCIYRSILSRPHKRAHLPTMKLERSHLTLWTWNCTFK